MSPVPRSLLQNTRRVKAEWTSCRPTFCVGVDVVVVVRVGVGVGVVVLGVVVFVFHFVVVVDVKIRCVCWLRWSKREGLAAAPALELPRVHPARVVRKNAHIL